MCVRTLRNSCVSVRWNVFQDSARHCNFGLYANLPICDDGARLSGKEPERQLGDIYKTAWSMGQQIRQLIDKADAVR
jgi:hypothetical protein